VKKKKEVSDTEVKPMILFISRKKATKRDPWDSWGKKL